eukprot:7093931-Karenia_brevis.AAC.1
MSTTKGAVRPKGHAWQTLSDIDAKALLAAQNKMHAHVRCHRGVSRAGAGQACSRRRAGTVGIQIAIF